MNIKNFFEQNKQHKRTECTQHNNTGDITMRGLSSTPSHNRRSKSTCSFCRSPKHQVTACQHIKPVWESLQQGIIPLTYMSQVDNNDTSGIRNTWRANHSYWTSPLSTYYTNGGTWGELYTAAEKAYEKWERAQARANAPKGKGSRTRLQTCGYCKETGHTRTKCSYLTDHKELLIQANRNFRKWFYQEYVEKQGLSTGAIISFDFVKPKSWNAPAVRTKVQTIVTDVNWDSINLLSVLDMYTNVTINYSTEVDGAKSEKMNNIRDFLRSDVLCKVPKTALSQCDVSLSYHHRSDTLSFYGVPVGMLSTRQQTLKNFDNHDLVGWRDSNYIENFSVVQRSPQVLSDDWIDGFSDQMSVIFKKFTQAQLEFFGVIEHIKLWANKEL